MTVALVAPRNLSLELKIGTIKLMATINKHIGEYDHETFCGFRVAIQKKGIAFVRYFSTKKMDRETALNEAIAYEAELMRDLSSCKTVDDVLVVFKKHNS